MEREDQGDGEMKRVVAAYFSPTSGTKKAALLLAEKLVSGGQPAAREIDLTKAENRGEQILLGNDSLLIAACPVYGGVMPPVEGLFENLQGNGTHCVVMAAYGNRDYEDTLAQLKSRLEAQGFLCIAAIACVIPHVFSEKLGSGRPDAADLSVIVNFAEGVKAKLVQGELAPVMVPGNGSPQKREIKPVTKRLDREACRNCQKCVKECPVGAISSENLDFDASLCISCMRCVKVCEWGAWSFDAAAVKAYLEQNYQARREIETFV